MLRNVLVAAVTAVVLALGIAFQIFGTTSHEEKDESPRSIVTPVTPSPGETPPLDAPGVDDPAETPAPTDERSDDETNDQDGKPGEAPKG